MQDQVLAFWFPPGLDRDLDTHRRQWQHWMRGGVHAAITQRFSALTEEAAQGLHDDWAATPAGRLALVLVLDQFSRSVFQGTPHAYAQDARALALVTEGLACGHYDQLDTVWAKAFFALPLVHAEGPDLVDRIERNARLSDTLVEQAPEPLRPMYEFAAAQARRHLAVARRFGRHPHRNAILGRPSTGAEASYLREGRFPHETPIQL